MVVVVEIFRRNFLAAMVPVIVNAILNEHQLVIDIVAFVNKGDFHRSRLGEKQRGKILAGWVTRKMRTIAQYSIRDPHGDFNQINEEPGMTQGRTSTGTFRNSMMGGSIKGSVHGSMRGMNAQMQNLQLQMGGAQELQGQPQTNFAPPAGMSEMAAQAYSESIAELASTTTDSSHTYYQKDGSDATPTDPRKEFVAELDGGIHKAINYGYPGDRQGNFNDEVRDDKFLHYGASELQVSELPTILRPGVNPDDAGPPEPQYSNKPFIHPVHDGNGGQFNFNDESSPIGAGWSLPPEHSQHSQHHPESGDVGGGGGGLRVANADSADEQEWAQDALMHMNFAGSGPEKFARLD